MQKISFGNREYVKASEAAKRFKYTQDYIGQLCRGDKVDARLVGRVWYVNLESITEYRKTKHATQKKAAKNYPTTKRNPKSAVEPVVRPKTARKLQEIFPNEAKIAVRHVSATYSRDQTANIPVLTSVTTGKQSEASTQKEKRMVIIKVRPHTKKGTLYQTEKIPDVALNSKLKVTDNIIDLVPATLADAYKNSAPGGSHALQVSNVAPEPAKETVNFHPTPVPQPKPALTKAPAAKKATPRSRLVGWSLRSVYFSGAIGAALLLLGGTHFIETGALAPTSGVRFDVDTAFETIRQLFQ